MNKHNSSYWFMQSSLCSLLSTIPDGFASGCNEGNASGFCISIAAPERVCSARIGRRIHIAPQISAMHYSANSFWTRHNNIKTVRETSWPNCPGWRCRKPHTGGRAAHSHETNSEVHPVAWWPSHVVVLDMLCCLALFLQFLIQEIPRAFLNFCPKKQPFV